jgi:hypothetical protein
LNGAKGSLVDVKAQTDIVLNPVFVPYLNKGQSIVTINEIFTKTEVREWKKEQEPLRPVHKPWMEINEENNIKWEPTEADAYDGSVGGGTVGPSSAMQQVVRTADSLAAIFLFMVPISFFDKVAAYTTKFCYEDWVVEKFGTDRDGVQKKRRHFEQVPEKLGRRPYPGRRHRADKEHKKFNITSGFVLCWIACLILQGAHFGADKRSAGKLWRDQPYGLSLPYLQNAMTRNSYVFMRQYIHFVDNSKRVPKG